MVNTNVWLHNGIHNILKGFEQVIFHKMSSYIMLKIKLGHLLVAINHSHHQLSLTPSSQSYSGCHGQFGLFSRSVAKGKLKWWSAIPDHIFQVYDQLNSLAQKNPWFVRSLQSIMSSAAAQDGSLPVQLPQLPVRAENSATGVDPAQAALILLLAGEPECRWTQVFVVFLPISHIAILWMSGRRC